MFNIPKNVTDMAGAAIQATKQLTKAIDRLAAATEEQNRINEEMLT